MILISLWRNSTFIAFYFSDQCTDWYYWLMALNSIMNPWIYLSLNRDLQLSLYYCCFPCQSSNNCQTSSHENVILPENQNSKNDFLRPRSFTASEAQIARDRYKMRPFSNNSYQRQESRSISNDIPKMRCRLNTFQL